MKASGDTKHYSTEALKSARARGETVTRLDAPVYPVDEDFWRNARIAMPRPSKTSVHLRLDADVLEWFRAQGQGHLSRMNAVLRSFTEANKR